jgi:hypothetical protein
MVSAISSIAGKIKSNHPEKIIDSVRSGVEISFMVLAGFVTTAIMLPIVMNRGAIAHKINKILGTDKHVLPDNLIVRPEPKTLEDKIDQEVHKHVNKRITAADVWKARFLTIAGVLVGDQLVNSSSRWLESKGLQSIDTLSWRLGQKIYSILPKEKVSKFNEWCSNHGASIEMIEKNMKEHFSRLKKTEIEFGEHGGIPLHERVPINDRMVISEQSRILVKELGWAFIAAAFLHQLTNWYHNRRVKSEEQTAIAHITKQGLVPEGYKVVLTEDVKLERINGWAEKNKDKKLRPEKSENYVKSVDNSRTAAEQIALS